MKPRSLIFALIITCIFVFSACSRINISSDNGTEGDEPSASATAGNPTSTPEEDGPPTETPEATAQEEASATPASGETDAGIREIEAGEAGLEPLLLSDMNGKKLNSRLQELLQNFYGAWGIEDYAKGIELFNDVILVLPRYTDAVAGKAGIGQSFDAITKELGPCSYKEEGLLVYRTGDYYLAFYGSDKAQYAALTYTWPKDYDDDFLYNLIKELDSDGFTSLEESIDKIDPDMEFFKEKGSPDGAGYYANALYGINVSDVEEPIIDVMNNYEGTLYIQDGGGIRYSVAFVNLDAVVLMLKDALYRCENIDTLLEQGGVLSPDGGLKAVYDPEGFIIVRTLDASIQDRCVYTWISGDFYWLGSRYILYTENDSTIKCVDVNDSSLWGEDLLQLAAVSNPSSSGYKIAKVDANSITLEDLDGGENLVIRYEFGGDGAIAFTEK